MERNNYKIVGKFETETEAIYNGLPFILKNIKKYSGKLKAEF